MYAMRDLGRNKLPISSPMCTMGAWLHVKFFQVESSHNNLNIPRFVVNTSDIMKNTHDMAQGHVPCEVEVGDIIASL